MQFEPFTLIISVYEKENASFFDRSLESITLLQSVMPDEIILVVDGPVNKDLGKIIDKYCKKYNFFKVIRLAENKGLGNALKIAVLKAKNNLIARMDSDGLAEKTRFEQQLQFFKVHLDVDIVGGDITEFIGEEKNIITRREVPCTNREIKQYMKKRCAFNHVTVMFKRDAVLKAGNYRDWYWNEDYFLWIRMQLKNAVFANLGVVLVNVRAGKEMYRRRGGIEYFRSEAGIQKYMLQHGMISKYRYIINIWIRLMLQVLMPDSFREIIFKTIARKKFNS